MSDSGKKRVKCGILGAFWGSFPRFFEDFCLSFEANWKIVLLQTKNHSHEIEKSKCSKRHFRGLTIVFLPPFFAICMNFTAQNIRAWCSSFLCFLCHGESAVARFCGAYGYGCHRKTVQAFFLYEGQPGVAVVCEGGGNAAVQNRVTALVETLTGVGANHITVAKMASTR